VVARHRKASHLARWLGPWADAAAVPSSVDRESETLTGNGGDREVRAYRYEPRSGEVSGTYVIVQGLHYSGPDDPRMDRFCRVIASAGFSVIAPFLTDFMQLQVTPAASHDVAIACDHAVKLCAQRGLPRPALFSISFGSTPAIEVAASERHRDAIGALVLFGGFRDFNAIIRFAITARAFADGASVDIPHDPLNAPAVFINLIDHIKEAASSRSALKDQWLEMARRTWGSTELNPVAKRLPIAESLANDLPPAQRELFMIGCGLEPGGAALLEVGLANADAYFAFTDPTPHLARIAMPVVISHGRDDHVIPFTEADRLRAALPSDLPHRLHITGMYGHTGAAVPSPSSLAGELGTMLDTLYSIVDAPHEAITN
jgi:pimeloyl-ACP methyl ester carboxylesterase